MTYDVEHLFICLFCHLPSFFDEVSIQIFCLFLNWGILEFYEFLYILDSSPLPVVYFANVFSESVAGLLILLTIFYRTAFQIDSQREFAVWLRKLKQGFCINLEGWGGEGDGREVQKGGGCMYTYG